MIAQFGYRNSDNKPWICAFGCGTVLVPVIDDDSYCYWKELASGARHYDLCAAWQKATAAL